MNIRIRWGFPWYAQNKEHRGNQFIVVQTWCLVKYKYCQSCEKAYIKSRLEKDNCIYCNEPCETVDVKRNGIYYYGYALMVLGAGSVLVPRFTVVSDPTTYLVVGIVLAFVGTMFIIMGSSKMAKTAIEMAADSEELESEDDDS